MNRQEFNEHVKQVFDRTEKVLVKKGAEYSTNENVFHNFDAGTGISLHKTNTAVAWEYCSKHLQSIKDIIQEIEDGNLSRLKAEIIDEKFGDAINYFILIEGMLKQKIKNGQSV
jgi:hypothetical protein